MRSVSEGIRYAHKEATIGGRSVKTPSLIKNRKASLSGTERRAWMEIFFGKFVENKCGRTVLYLDGRIGSQPEARHRTCLMIAANEE